MFEEFKKVSKEEWVEVLKKEIKTTDFDNSMTKNDEIEEISFSSFIHSEEMKLNGEKPSAFPYKRGYSRELNDWDIVSKIKVSSEKEANQKALHLLMSGASSLYFALETNSTPNYDALFEGILFEYINLYFEVENEALLKSLSDYFDNKQVKNIIFNYNPLALKEDLSEFSLLNNTNNSFKNFTVDSYSIQQAGANCYQEIAFALTLGHSYISEQIKSGKTIAEAINNIHFLMGIGSNYLFEISKFRAFRILWSKICSTYFPEYKNNANTIITAQTGFINKSLKDPYTNLLRQTTEVMSAVLGGVNAVINQAYDSKSGSKTTGFSERMAINISLILKEESYLNQVIDSLGGAYIIEDLTVKLANTAWGTFQKMNKEKNLHDSFLINEIKKTRNKRIDFYRENKGVLIGINKFHNPTNIDLKWKNKVTNYFGIDELILEKELI
jgi:methylmalonyl-CoA mutase